MMINAVNEQKSIWVNEMKSKRVYLITSSTHLLITCDDCKEAQ